MPLTGSQEGDAPFFSPDGHWIGFITNGQIRKAPLPTGATTTLAGIADALEATWAPDGSIIYSSSTTSGLFRLDTSGATKPLTVPDPSRHEASHRDPIVLPGGTSVLFSVRLGGGAERMRLAVVPIDGSREPRVVLEDGGAYPQFSVGNVWFLQANAILRVPFDPARLEVKGPAATVVEDVARVTRFALAADGTLASVNDLDERRLQVVWMDARGAVADAGMPRDNYAFPQLSPDNTHVALTRLVGKNLEVWLYDLARGTFSRFASEGTLNHIPVWTPDGRRVLFSSDRSGAANLYWQPVDGTGTAERLTTSVEHQDPGSFSRDGTLLTFTAQSLATDWDIWVLPLEGSRQPRIYKQTRAAEYHPMLSPDGHWLAYTSNESGKPEVYVEAFPGGGSKQQISNNGGFSSLWSLDGRQLYYRAGPDALMVVDVQPGTSFGAGRPRLALTKVFGGLAGYGAPVFSLGRDNRWLFLTPRDTLHARIDVIHSLVH